MDLLADIILMFFVFAGIAGIYVAFLTWLGGRRGPPSGGANA